MRTIDTGTSFLTLEEFISHLEQNFRQHDYVQGIDLDGVYYADRPGVGRVVQFAPEKQELKTLRYVVSELLDGGMDIDDLAEYLQLTGVEI